MMKRALCCVVVLLLVLVAPMQSLAEAIGQDEWIEMIAQDALSTAEVESEDEDSHDEGQWWNILLLGCDNRSTKSYSRTDSMIILSVNTEAGKVKMTSLMRDTWVTVPGKSSHRKLTELCAVGGPELTIRAINESFGMDIEDYALISMVGIAEVIDLVGGIELDVTEAERKALNKGLFNFSSASGMEKLQESGEQVHLNGNQATAFARIRQIDSDFVRTERQRTVLVTLAKKIMSGASAGTMMTIMTTLLQYVDTNLSFLDIVELADAAFGLDLDAVEQLRLPADGTYDAGTFSGVWCIKPNFSKNKTILHDFIYGEEAVTEE